MQVVPIEMGGQALPGIEGDAHVADDALAAGAVEAAAEIIVHGGPGVDQGRFGVENETVKIKNQG